MPFQSRDFESRYGGGGGGGGRSAEDYGLTDLDDSVLQELASNPKRYGEKSGLAAKELASRRGLSREADTYRAALERGVYQQLSPQFSQGLSRITGHLAGAGPLADSGYANALRSQLGAQIYGQAQGQIGGKYSDYLSELYGGKRRFSQQKQLMQYERKTRQPTFAEIIAGAAGGAGGAVL
jgi:hypothetical protein